MELFILRHGQAEPQAASDSQRPLTATGRAEVAAVIKQNLPSLQAVTQLWVSPYLRAQQTADEVARLLPGPVRHDCPAITPDGLLSDVIDRLASASGETPLLVSHQPLVGDLVNGIAGKPAGYYSMATAALAYLTIDPVALGCGDVQWLR